MMMEGGKIYVQIRDPRAATLSTFHHHNKYHPLKTKSFDQMFLRNVQDHAEWIAHWLSASRKKYFNVKFVLFQDLINNPKKVFNETIPETTYSPYKEKLEAFLETIKNDKSQIINFVSGDDSKWREMCSQELQNRAWEVIPNPVKDLLSLAP